MFWSGEARKVKCSHCNSESYVPIIASFNLSIVFTDIVGVLGLLLIKDQYNLSWSATLIIALGAVLCFRILDLVILQPQKDNAKIRVKLIAMWVGSILLILSGLNWVLTHL